MEMYVSTSACLKFPNWNFLFLKFTPVNDVVGTYDATDKDSTSLYYKLIVEPVGASFIIT